MQYDGICVQLFTRRIFLVYSLKYIRMGLSEHSKGTGFLNKDEV